MAEQQTDEKGGSAVIDLHRPQRVLGKGSSHSRSLAAVVASSRAMKRGPVRRPVTAPQGRGGAPHLTYADGAPHGAHRLPSRTGTSHAASGCSEVAVRNPPSAPRRSAAGSAVARGRRDRGAQRSSSVSWRGVNYELEARSWRPTTRSSSRR